MPTRAFTDLDLEKRGEWADNLAPKLIAAGYEVVSDEMGQPYILVTEIGLQMVGDSKKVFSVSPEFGLNLQGPISLAAFPEQISIGGGYWRINPLVLTCVPSTTPTPIPWLVKSTPKLTQASGDIGGVVSFLKGFST
jgi:hypothetical protein